MSNMTPVEHAALSAELARALGWQDVECLLGDVVVVDNYRAFDYRDPTVCLPLIEWLALQLVVVEPNRNLWLAKQQCWTAWRYEPDRGWWYESDSGNVRRWVASAYELPECVARAVIAVKEKL